MQRLLQYILKKLKVKCWGLKWEIQLPPEFIITKHGLDRLYERMPGFQKIYSELVITAWYDGSEDLPDWFDPDSAEQRSVRRHYESVVYKHHFNKVFIFGTRYREKLGADQKYLITIYNRRA